LAAVTGAVAVVFAPAAAADPSSPSYAQGQQAIEEQVQQFHVQLNLGTDLNQYCQQLLLGDLKRGRFARVDSGPDFVGGCQDEGRALLAA
jgi:hypothetical protein